MSTTEGLITSGGGFSDHYKRPSWQDEAVAGYFNSTRGNTTLPGYNTTGRGYPDLSALGNAYIIIVGNATQVVSGTSASCESKSKA